jgi:catechol 2,3-dioxygenase-like lactoylglutathione lyase family enzyme
MPIASPLDAVTGGGRIVSLRGFATINFWADDLAAAVAWYTQFLGVEPYFERPGPDGGTAYVEFRVGDYQAELGLIDRTFRAARGGERARRRHHVLACGRPQRNRGATAVYWRNGVPADHAARGRGVHHRRGVADPFGNVLGVMYNPQYVEVLNAIKPA